MSETDITNIIAKLQWCFSSDDIRGDAMEDGNNFRDGGMAATRFVSQGGQLHHIQFDPSNHAFRIEHRVRFINVGRTHDPRMSAFVDGFNRYRGKPQDTTSTMKSNGTRIY